MEVDHFLCKSLHPQSVVEWNNLLPACKRCNVNKGGYDVAAEGSLIDPSIDNPRDHLRWWNYRLFGRDDKGTRSIDVMYLNETSRIVSARFDIGNTVAAALEKLKLIAEECLADPSQNRKVIQLVRGLTKMLEEAGPTSEYSAAAATSVSLHPHYQSIKQAIVDLNRWSPDLALLEAKMHQAALST
jgi:hypothetical protein